MGKEKDIWECDLGAQEVASSPDSSGLYVGTCDFPVALRPAEKGVGLTPCCVSLLAKDCGLLPGTPPALLCGFTKLPVIEIRRAIK